MTISTSPENIVLSFPDHTQLPESDGSIVQNFQEHPQSILLTDSITPILHQLHPDGQYCIGQDSERLAEKLRQMGINPDEV